MLLLTKKKREQEREKNDVCKNGCHVEREKKDRKKAWVADFFLSLYCLSPNKLAQKRIVLPHVLLIPPTGVRLMFIGFCLCVCLCGSGWGVNLLPGLKWVEKSCTFYNENLWKPMMLSIGAVARRLRRSWPNPFKSHLDLYKRA